MFTRDTFWDYPKSAEPYKEVKRSNAEQIAKDNATI